MTHLLMDLPLLDLPTLAANATHASDALQAIHGHLSDDWLVLAQQFKETDLPGEVGKAWGHFVKTGQVWALLAGLIVGYLARALTSYG
ncbi:hypothetical protein [Myxacorys almedinensis]|uniref:hypothetical protein n=1 Tax=Myxacorys almedinensis TaxID=2651157 RepID=UPI00192EAD62|nr:hypothetical protein [Myxacorys almedinensis]